MSKRPWESKTLWSAFILSALALVVPGADEFVKHYPIVSVVIQQVLAVALRFATNGKISVTQP